MGELKGGDFMHLCISKPSVVPGREGLKGPADQPQENHFFKFALKKLILQTLKDTYESA